MRVSRDHQGDGLLRIGIADGSFPPPGAGGCNDPDDATTIAGMPTGAELGFANYAGTLVQNGARVKTAGQRDAATGAINADYGRGYRGRRPADRPPPGPKRLNG